MSPELDEAQAWSDYWRAQKGGCMPAASPALDKLFRQEWARVASALPHRARVLDIATGDGVVLRWISEARADLDLNGIDLAEPLPPPPPGCILQGGVSMDALPFVADSFEAIVSQFGFEYGDLARTAAEVARVLRPGGSLTLIAHHAGSPIVAHNRQRAAGLKWAIDDARLFAVAHEPGRRDHLEQATRLAIEQFGMRSAGWELADAIRRVVSYSPADLDAPTRNMLDRLQRMARGELQRIAALERASLTASAEGGLETALRNHGLLYETHHPVTHQGLTLANHWAFKRD